MTDANHQQATEANPVLIFDTFNAHQRSAALRGAIELDLFTAIAEGQGQAAQLADHCRAEQRPVRILCDYLVISGFLTKENDQYSLTPTAAAFLDRRSPRYMGAMARFVNSPDLLESFRDVAQLVRRGTTLLQGQGTIETGYEGWVEFARTMVPMIMPAAEFMGAIAAQRLSGPIRVLDVAAGHGMFGISVAQRNSRATIVALDWDKVLEVARENAVRAGVQDRDELLPGDATQIGYGTGYDLVLLTNILHHFDAATCVSLLQKVRGSLKDNGVVMTLEFVPNEDRVSPPTAASFAFTMLGTTPAGDAYTFAEYDRMFRQAGLGRNELVDVPNSPQRLILSSPSAG